MFQLIPTRTGLARAAVVTLVAASALVVGGTTAAAAPAVQNITAADIVDIRAPEGTTQWFSEVSKGGSLLDDAYNGTDSLALDVPSASASVRVLKTYGAGVRPQSDLPALLSDASYSYAGANVNFQIEMFYTPVDPAYGPDSPTAENRCTPAFDEGVAVPGQCYTVIKWEPFVDRSTWTTVDLSADTAADSPSQTGGWKNSQRIGTYAKPGAMIGNTLTEYLAQMSDYTVIGVGLGLGSGTSDARGWVRDASFGGVDYRFAQAPPSDITVGPGESVQNAIDTVAEGGTVHLNPGSYDEEIRIRKSVSLVGNGEAGSVVFNQPAAGRNKLIDIYNTSNVTIENIVVDGSARVEAGGQTSTGIDANSVHGLTLTDVTVRNFAKNGIAVTGKWSEDTPTSSSDIHFDGISVTNNQWAGIAFYTLSTQGVGVGISNVTFSGPTAVSDNAKGIQFGDPGDHDGVTGVDGGPVRLGIITFAGNEISVINSDQSEIELDRASTVDGRPVTTGDFEPGTLRIVPAASTTIVLSASPSGAILEGGSVTLTATVRPNTATGTIRIFDSGSEIAQHATTSGSFTFSTSLLSLGAHTLTAQFIPSDPHQFSSSTSAALSFTVNQKNAPAPPPAANTEQLDERIARDNIDVAAITESFAPSGGAADNPLNAFDRNEPLSGELPWPNTTDSFVDVYAFSTPVFLGTFPVVDGKVILTGVDLSKLEAGGHQLVFVGQTSGEMQVMAVTIASAEPDPTTGDDSPSTGSDGAGTSEDSSLASTGAEVAYGFVALAPALMVLGGMLLMGRRRARS
ncbi:hypothetical protein GCM10027416_08020 [Okibacterium endophyticum]